MKVSVFTLHSFSHKNNGGNPAGVVLNADKFSDTQMQAIAKKVNFSETAFVQQSETADFKVRFFTPQSEVPLCGHATIATFYVLAYIHNIKAGTYTQETKAGILSIEIVIINNKFFLTISPVCFT